MRVVEIAGRRCGGGEPLLWIAGPCVIESRELTLNIAEALAAIAKKLRISLVFKASFDKANRSSGKSFRGLGQDAGLKILEEVRSTTGLPVTTDVHETGQVVAVADAVDLIQVPA